MQSEQIKTVFLMMYYFSQIKLKEILFKNTAFQTKRMNCNKPVHYLGPLHSQPRLYSLRCNFGTYVRLGKKFRINCIDPHNLFVYYVPLRGIIQSSLLSRTCKQVFYIFI